MHKTLQHCQRGGQVDSPCLCLRAPMRCAWEWCRLVSHGWWVPWDFHGNGNKISHGMGMGIKTQECEKNTTYCKQQALATVLVEQKWLLTDQCADFRVCAVQAIQLRWCPHVHASLAGGMLRVVSFPYILSARRRTRFYPCLTKFILVMMVLPFDKQMMKPSCMQILKSNQL